MSEADHVLVGEIGFAAWQSSDASAHVSMEPQMVERVHREFLTFATSTVGDVHLAETGGELLGWAARDGDRDYISDLWVHPRHQSKGIGRALLSHLVAIIASEGHSCARIHTHASNAGAIRLYRACGFEIVWRGTEYSKGMGIDLAKVHLGKDLAVLMRADLERPSVAHVSFP